MPKIYHHICEQCLAPFDSRTPRRLFCNNCQNAKKSSGLSTIQYTLVCVGNGPDAHCNAGMIGYRNTLKTWSEFDIEGAIIERDGAFMAWDGQQFIPCDNPYPPAKSSAEWYKCETGWHVKQQLAAGITAGGYA